MQLTPHLRLPAEGRIVILFRPSFLDAILKEQVPEARGICAEFVIAGVVHFAVALETFEAVR